MIKKLKIVVPPSKIKGVKMVAIPTTLSIEEVRAARKMFDDAPFNGRYSVPDEAEFVFYSGYSLLNLEK